MLIEPKISIITVNYNDSSGLQRTIKSVQEQSFRNFEHIVIDGDSNDGSKEIIQKHASEFAYWISESDGGIYNAMNKGITVAQGEYLYFLNSGDYFNDSKSLLNASKHLSKNDFIFFNIKVIENKDNYIKKIPEELSFFYLQNNVPPHQATFSRREIYEKIGHFDESFKIVADWKLIMIALLKHNSSYKVVDEIFSTYVNGGLSSSDGSYEAMQLEREKVLRNEFPIFLNDLDEMNRMNRVLRNLRKSNRIKLLVKLGLIDKF